jgi:hypothetical protein
MTHIVEISAFAQTSLWRQYIAIDYGRAVPEKEYNGFQSFLKDVTNADRVEGTTRLGFKLYFDNEKSYTWYLMRWS